MARTAWLLSLASVAGRVGLHGGSSSSASVAIEAAGLQAVILPCHDCDKWRKMMPATRGTTALSVFVRRFLFPSFCAVPLLSFCFLADIFFMFAHSHTPALMHTLIGGCNFGTYKMQPAICYRHRRNSIQHPPSPRHSHFRRCSQKLYEFVAASLACLPLRNWISCWPPHSRLRGSAPFS